jgi:hypothetical protein
MCFALTVWVARIHRDHLLAEAEKHRRDSRSEIAGSRRREHLLASIGTHLIFAGLWLRARYEPAVCRGAGPCS